MPEDVPAAKPVEIPHAAPLRFAQMQQRLPDGTTIVHAQVPSDCPIVSAGRVNGAWLIEIGAQAAAAFQGTGSGHAVRTGRLVGIRDWQGATSFAAGSELRVEVSIITDLGTLTAFAIRIQDQDTCLASGELQVHREA